MKIGSCEVFSSLHTAKVEEETKFYDKALPAKRHLILAFNALIFSRIIFISIWRIIWRRKNVDAVQSHRRHMWRVTWKDEVKIGNFMLSVRTQTVIFLFLYFVHYINILTIFARKVFSSNVLQKVEIIVGQ